MPKRHPDNAPGDWYIDRECMDCSAARSVAPDLIVSRGGQSVFARQPTTPEEVMMAWRARLLCPTASVRTERRADAPAEVFPEKMTDGVYRLGYNSKDSYGAHSFLIERPGGNAMVDSPRWTKHVVTALEKLGGLAHVLLTHKDDVADADRYARHFGARVSIHKEDRGAAPYADHILEGRDPIRLYDDLVAIPVPGHTKGSVVYFWDNRCLFSGDSLSWSFGENDLSAFRDFCWYSWDEQRKSLTRLLDYDFEWVFAGHGGSHGGPPDEMKRRLQKLVERMGRAV
jgi:glyoxylase-like metal-dependent hydrolase (beta-lactamase superfamily II)